MNNEETIIAMFMRLEMAALYISNVAATSKDRSPDSIGARQFAHAVENIIDLGLVGLGVSRREVRLERKVPTAFLASFMRADELDALREYMARRDAAYEQWMKENQA